MPATPHNGHTRCFTGLLEQLDPVRFTQKSEITDAERALIAIDFFKTRYPEHIMRSIRSLAHRAGPDSREITLLRAAAIEVMRSLERASAK